jgi:hypothetical protein
VAAQGGYMDQIVYRSNSHIGITATNKYNRFSEGRFVDFVHSQEF